MSGHSGVDVGDRAPDFTLRASFEQQIELAEVCRRGPVVLVFYVFDFGGL